MFNHINSLVFSFMASSGFSFRTNTGDKLRLPSHRLPLRKSQRESVMTHYDTQRHLIQAALRVNPNRQQPHEVKGRAEGQNVVFQSLAASERLQSLATAALTPPPERMRESIKRSDRRRCFGESNKSECRRSFKARCCSVLCAEARLQGVGVNVSVWSIHTKQQ